jgi:hypothetical protein
VTPQDALEQIVTAAFLMPGIAPVPGGLIKRHPEDSELRKALRKLTSEDAARTRLPRCSVPGCQLLRPAGAFDRGLVPNDGTCGRHKGG